MPASEPRIAVVDVETTGLYPGKHDRVIEVGIVVLSDDGEICGEYETLINPQRDIGPSHIHQITSDEILDAPLFPDVAGDIAEILRHAFVIGGHNVDFDCSFLAKEYERAGYAMPNYRRCCTFTRLGGKLEVCCKDFGIDFDGQVHSALHDARAAAKLIQFLLQEDESFIDRRERSLPPWPPVSPRATPPVTRRHARERLSQPPSFLARIASRVTHDTDTMSANELAYLALVERVIEDRVIDAYEEDLLVDTASSLGLSLQQVTQAHQDFLRSLAGHALADGVVTETERKDLHRVALLLGQNPTEIDAALETASGQLQGIGARPTGASGDTELTGLSVCFSGELQGRINGALISKPVAGRLAENAGLVVKNSVTKKLDILVLADPNSQSGKAKKAREYGTRILAEAVFWNKIGVPVQ